MLKKTFYIILLNISLSRADLSYSLQEEFSDYLQELENTKSSYKSVSFKKDYAIFNTQIGDSKIIPFNKKNNNEEDVFRSFAYKNEIFIKNDWLKWKIRYLNFLLTLYDAFYLFVSLVSITTLITFTLSPLFDGYFITINMLMKTKRIVIEPSFGNCVVTQCGLYFTMITGYLSMLYDYMTKKNVLQIRFHYSDRPISFDQIGGHKIAKKTIKDLQFMIKNNDKNKNYRIPKGILLYGPPGTGKTLFAKAIAYEMGLPFVAVSSAEFDQQYAANIVQEIFKKVKVAKRCILFIDEIEAIAMDRTKLDCKSSTYQQVVSLLNEMDGFLGDGKVIVIGATNYIERIDQAFLRPGRFDNVLFIDNPNRQAREEILKIHSKNMNFANDVDLSFIAKITNGFSGASLAQLLNNAQLNAVNDKNISNHHLIIARDDLLYGEALDVVMSENDINEKAFHESAHALIAFDYCNFLDYFKISIIPRIKYGMIEIMEDEDWAYNSFNEYINAIKCCLASKAIADINGSIDISQEVSYDLKKANKLAREIVQKFGIDKSLFIPGESFDNVEINDYVDKCLNDCYNDVKNYLLKNMHRLELLKTVLLEKKLLDYSEIKKILEIK